MSEVTWSASGLTVDSKRARLERLLRERAVRPPIGNSDVTPQRVSRDGPLPVSFGQERLWFLEQLEPGRPTYNIPTVLELTGTLDLEALRWTLGEIVRRHEALRTTFTTVDARPAQVIALHGAPALPLVDLAYLSGSEARREADRLADAEALAPFDLGRGPLFRLTLLRLGPTEHRLLVTMHHTVADGWSLGIFLRELGALYQARVSGSVSPLPEPPLQYADFAAWQRAWLTAERLESQVAYWRERLDGIPPGLELPTDHARPATRSGRGGIVTRILPAELGDALRGLARRERVTLFMVLLAGFKILLARHANTEDIVVGSPISGRTRREMEGLIGFFVNTLVLRTDLSGEPTVREVLHRVRAAALGAYAHQEVPFEKLVGEVKPERSLDRTPLFQVMFNLVGFGEGDEIALPGLRMRLVSIERLEQMTDIHVKFDLTLYGREEGAEIRLVLEYAADLFERSTAERMLDRLRVVLAGMVADPDRAIAALPFVSEAERCQLLVEWNATTRASKGGRCVHEMFEAQAMRTPGTLAVADRVDGISYAELNRRANQVAHYLRRLGVVPETVVGVCMERSIDMVVAFLGVLKAGGAYLPMDPAYPQERLTFMAADAAAPVVLTHHCLRTPFEPPSGCRLVYVDGEDVRGEPDHNPDPLAGRENLAYVIYTSGSTGTPKGVAIEHAGLLNLVEWHRREYRVTAADRATQLAGPGFDAAVWELWPYLTAGASVHLPDEGTRLVPDQLLAWLASERITLTFMPTPLLEAALDAQWPPDLVLRAVLTGGDKLHRSPRQPLGCTLVNHYGPTENTVVTTWGPVSIGSDGPPPIGRPIDNTEVYVLDPHGGLVPVGVPGELYVGGAGLARGYVNRPELTAERFVAHPFRPGARLYRTGDLVRYRADGTLDFLGRIDQQVKIRGFRVELGEIEAVLAQHPTVRECAVLFRQEHVQEGRLVAYVVPTAGSTVQPPTLQAFVRQRLPDYMVPSTFIALASLPLTPNGKVDRRALPAPEFAVVGTAMEFVPPRTEFERTIADIWRTALGVDRVSLHDNFFDVGGHSLLLVPIQRRLEQALGRTVPIVTLFECPTVVALAERLTASPAEAGPAGQGAVNRAALQRDAIERARLRSRSR